MLHFIDKNDTAKSVLEGICRLWALGYPIDTLEINKLGGKPRAVLTDLPECPFNLSRRH